MTRSSHYKSVSERKGKNQFRGNRTVLQLTRGSRGLQMRKIQVGERLMILSSVSKVVSRATVLMSARIML